MKSDLNVYKSSLEQQNHSYAQLRTMQEQLTKDKNELEDVRLIIEKSFHSLPNSRLFRDCVIWKIDIREKSLI